MKHLPFLPGSNLMRGICRMVSLLPAVLALQTASAAVIFTDNFSDGSASDWRVRSATGTPNWAVANDNPAGEPSAGSQWLYANSNSATFAFIQSPNNGFSEAAIVTAEQSVVLTAGIYYTPTIPTDGRIELMLTDTNAAWTSATVTDHTYSVQLNLSGSDFSLSLVKRNGGTNTNLGNSATAFSLTSGTYYEVQMIIATGGSLTAKVYDAVGGEVASLSGTADATFTSFGSVLTHFRDPGSTTGFRVSDFEVQTEAVPEPSALAMAGAGCLALWPFRRKRKALIR